MDSRWIAYKELNFLEVQSRGGFVLSQNNIFISYHPANLEWVKHNPLPRLESVGLKLDEHKMPNADIPWNILAVYQYFTGPPNFWSSQQVNLYIFQK